jgi:hypothetical protein
MADGKRVAKLVCFTLLVLIAIVPFYAALRDRDYSHFACVGLGAGFFVVSSGLGLLFGLLRWLVIKAKYTNERQDLVLTGALWYCIWLIPASVAASLFIKNIGLGIKSLGFGAASGLGFLVVMMWLKLAAQMNIRALRHARRAETYADRGYGEPAEEEFSSEERPLGSVGEAFQPKFAWGKECSVCGKQHGAVPGVVRKWHECTRCGEIYCDECGRNLLGKRGLLEAERDCPSCGGRTRLI